MNQEAKDKLYEALTKLNKTQFKALFAIIAHYWCEYRYFISNQNFLNLWCELNALCHELDESFPDPCDDHKLIKDYCQAHPFYFIDMLQPEVVINLFCQYFNDRLDVLAIIAQKLHDEDLRAAYAHANEALGLDEDITELVTTTEEHVATLN